MKTITAFFYGLIFLAITGGALANVVYYEGFESVGAVTWPCDPEIGLDPYSGLDPNNAEVPWEINSDPNNGIVVINNPVPGTFEGSNYLRMERVRPQWVTEEYGGMSVSVALPAPLDGIVTVSFAFMHPEGELSVILRDSTAGVGENAVDLRFGPTGSVGYMYFGVPESTGLWYSRDEWHQVRIDANFNTYTYDVSLDGAKVSGILFGFSQTQFDNLHFGNGGSAIPALVYLDRIEVEAGGSACVSQIEADITGDCEVDLRDFAMFAASWLKSNIDP